MRLLSILIVFLSTHFLYSQEQDEVLKNQSFRNEIDIIIDYLKLDNREEKFIEINQLSRERFTLTPLDFYFKKHSKGLIAYREYFISIGEGVSDVYIKLLFNSKLKSWEEIELDKSLLFNEDFYYDPLDYFVYGFKYRVGFSIEGGRITNIPSYIITRNEHSKK